jgi:hypothetical protein
MWQEARDKKNIEYDISYWAFSARQTHFLGYLEEKPKVLELAIFENTCRFEAQFLIHHEELGTLESAVEAAQSLVAGNHCD